MKFNIVSRFDASKILFAADIPDDTESGLQTRVALEQATAARLTCAGLSWATAQLPCKKQQQHRPSLIWIRCAN